MRHVLSAVLFFAYVLVTGFGVLAVASFRADDLPAGALYLALAILAFWGAWECEAALDAQALKEFEGQFTD